jgi:hypothetical protein
MEVIGRAWICQLYDLECCLGSPSLKWPVGVVFIATNHFVAVGEICWRHWTLSGAPSRHPIVRVLEQLTVGGFVFSGTGQSDAAPDRYCSLSGAPLAASLTSARTVCAL